MFLSNGSLVTKTPVMLDRSDFFPYMPAMSNGWPSAYASIYTSQLWPYTVINKLANGTARLPLPVYRRDELSRPRADDHPMARLLAAPNPGMSMFDLLFSTSATKDIYGLAFWFKQRVRGDVKALFPLHPAAMTFDDERQRWSFDNGRSTMANIAPQDLVVFRHYNPTSTVYGLSPMEPLRATLENEWSARSATSAFWARGGRPGAVLKHPRRLTPPAAAALSARFDALQGGSTNTGKTLVLEEGMDYQPLTLTAEEAQYIETRKLNREEVCGAYDVPPPVVHILDRATFSNITEQMRSMYRDTMAPRLNAFEAAIELELRAVEWPNDDVYAEFLLDEVLRGDFEARSAALKSADWMTLAEKRRIENLPFIPGTDRIFMNTATLPLDAIDAQAAALVAQTEAPPEPAAIPVRSILGRLSWQKTLDQVDSEALIAGLPATAAARVTAALASASTVAELREAIK